MRLAMDATLREAAKNQASRRAEARLLGKDERRVYVEMADVRVKLMARRSGMHLDSYFSSCMYFYCYVCKYCAHNNMYVYIILCTYSHNIIEYIEYVCTSYYVLHVFMYTYSSIYVLCVHNILKS